VLCVVVLAGCATGESSSAELMTESIEAKGGAEGPAAAVQAASGNSIEDDVTAVIDGVRVLETIRKADYRWQSASNALGTDRDWALREMDAIIAERPEDPRYRAGRARAALLTGDVSTAKSQWAEQDRLATEQGLVDEEYWQAVAMNTAFLDTFVRTSDGAYGGAVSMVPASNAAIERQILACEELADLATARLDTEAANMWFDQAAQLRARLNQ
jgi:hypothetical protein